MSNQGDSRAGLAFGIGVYLLWGLVPLYFVLLSHVGAAEIVAHRILWSVPLLIALLAILGWLGKLRAIFLNRKTLATLALSATVIAVNWLIYIWAVTHQHVLAASLGYYLNPLINVLLGTLLLGERLRPAAKISVALALVGVAILAIDAFATLWISVSLAFSFAFYGYLRKIVDAGAIEGLATETMLLALPSLAWLVWLASRGSLGFGADIGTDLLLICSAAVTAVPLMLFAAAARRLTLTTLGFIQYIAPTLAFLIGVFILGEPLRLSQTICFVFIWAGLILFTADNLHAARRRALERSTAAYGADPAA